MLEAEQGSSKALPPGVDLPSLDAHLSPPTVEEAIQRAAARLRPVTETPRLEAEVLLNHVLGTSRAELLADPDCPLTTGQRRRYQMFVLRRASHYPLPYITGHIEFYGLEIEVTPEVLIPRPETELLVDLALERLPSRIIDVGTGSGCIAVALATHLPDAIVYAIDVSSTALAVARRNVEDHQLDGRVRLMLGDVLTPRPSPVALIVSNPPYVSTNEWASLPTSVRNHEPRLALDGGPNGLSLIREVLAQSQGALRPDGRLLIEIGAGQGEAVMRLARTFYPQEDVLIQLHSDLAGLDRVLEVQT